MQRIPNRSRGELTDEEERLMREAMNHDPGNDEVYEGTPNPIIVFRVELDHAQMAALSAVRARTPDRPNPADLIQRWVEDRLGAEAAALGIERSA